MVRIWIMSLVFTIGAQAADACRLALVLAMDVSNSVDADEDALQRSGLAAALRTPGVRDAFFGSDDPVAVAVFEWSGRHHQRLMQDWLLIDSPDKLDLLADAIEADQRFYYEFPTAIGYAFGYAASLLDRAPICLAQTIDISGDGVNNDGFDPTDAYAAFDLDGVTVNGLVIDVPEDAPLRAGKPDLATYYARNVIQGPAAFIEVADGFSDFARAMERKLIRELQVMILGQSSTTVRHGG